MSQTMTRARAARACLAVLDADLFRALCEPARVEVVRRLVLLGRADVGTIAEGLPQDRSVVSRHLQVLERAGVVIASRQSRQVFYELDGPAVLGRFRGILDLFETLAPICCPGSGRAADAGTVGVAD
jgi:DNA-binding transcriptional ArsR family regulator